jgi:hypothetical protein
MTDPLAIDMIRTLRETHNNSIEAAAKVARLYEDETIALAILSLKVEIPSEPNHSSHPESNEAP